MQIDEDNPGEPYLLRVIPVVFAFGEFCGITPCRIDEDEDHPRAPHLLRGIPVVFTFGGFSRDFFLQIDHHQSAHSCYVAFPSSLPFGEFGGITYHHPKHIDEDHPSAPDLSRSIPVVFAFRGFSRDLPYK